MEAVLRHFSVFFLLICLSYTVVADDAGMAGAHSSEGYGPIFGSGWVPEGTKIPKTWGLSITTMSMEQDSKLSGVTFRGRAGEYIKDLSFNRVEDDSQVSNIRLDAWVLPFMNVYLMAGYMEGKTLVDSTTVFDPTPNFPGGELSTSMTMYQKYYGINWGLGATLVYGKGPWVTTLDINASRAELNVVRSRVNAVMVTPRIGYTSRIGGFPVTWMAGVSYLWLDQRITVEQQLPGVSEPMVLELDVKADNPWSPTLGATIQFSNEFQGVLEAGFDGRQMLIGSLVYRFAL
ncbi:hypothetical protein [Endozoicomonas atrinae]|uniref:hypothetical protein n=1 Tax=Endozoicomonas atrinae TaxID=1333660 RepID=UPI000824E501|nr:hypothetical protein [Endozoicomonas atrinae]